MTFASSIDFRGQGSSFFDSLRRLPPNPDEDTSVQKYFRSSVLDAKTVIALDQEQDNVETNDLKTNTRMHHCASSQDSSTFIFADGGHIMYKSGWLTQDLDRFCVRSCDGALNASAEDFKRSIEVRNLPASMSSSSFALSEYISDVNDDACYVNCADGAAKKIDNHDDVSYAYVWSSPVSIPHIFVRQMIDFNPIFSGNF